MKGGSQLLKIEIHAIGREKDTWLNEGIAHYQKLLAKYASVEITTLGAKGIPSSLPPNEIRRQEAALFKKKPFEGTIVALCDRGEKTDSLQFAKILERLAAHSRGAIRFLIGGPWGLDEELVARAELSLSLSPLTFSHQLVRLILLEQIYRALSILHGDPYHK